LIDEKIKAFGLRLFILSGYRHADLQRAILKAAIRGKGDDFAKKMLANPNYYTPHATGAVFDIEIWSEKENSMLPTKTEKGFGRYVLEGLENLSSKEIIILENRRLIHNLLSTDYILRKDKLFIPHPFEYWHYGRNEKLSKFFNQDNDYPVFYDVIQ